MTKIKLSKCIISTGMVFSLLAGAYVLFFREMEGRRIVPVLFYSMLLVYQARYFYLINFAKKGRVTFQLIEKQKYPVFLDTFVGVFLFGILPVILAFVNKKFNDFFTWDDIAATFVYLFGTVVTLAAEAQRRKWKTKNPGSLYQNGLFRYANHINYFGEMLSFPAFCWLASGSFIVFALVLAHQVIDFVFVQIPKQEKYLKEKYPVDFPKIANRKKLIPFIY